MKLLRVFIICFFSLLLGALIRPAVASHISGGELTVANIGNDSFQITLNFFRDCSGIGAPGSATVRITSSCTTTQNVALSLTNPGGTEVSQICSSQLTNSTCNGGTLPGMQRFTYQTTVVLNDTCSDYRFAYRLYARNPSVNVANGTTSSFYIDATLNTTLFPDNSTPEFTAPPIPYVCLSQNVNYNFGLVEPDGDSLSFALVEARRTTTPTSWVTVPMTYNTGYSGANPISGIVLDTNTGQISFTPTTPTGNYVVVMQVTEYNGAGQVISTVQRDIQFVVANCSNQTPDAPSSITNVTGTADSTDVNEVSMDPGENFCMDIVFQDTANTGDTITLTSNVTQVLSGATFNTSGTNPVTATVCWTAPTGVNLSPIYSFQVFANDGACPIPATNSFAVQVNVSQPDTISGSLTISHQSCSGVCDGTASIAASGGVGPYSYVWLPLAGIPTGQGTPNVTNLCPGSYGVLITDLGDPDPSTNSEYIPFSINAAPLLTISSANVQNDDCTSSTCNGAISVVANGGTGSLSYTWSDGGSGNARTGLCAGSYTVTVTDANNCTVEEDYTIISPTTHTVALDSLADVSCNGLSDGYASVSIDPGCGPAGTFCSTGTYYQIGSSTTTNNGFSYPAPYGGAFRSARQQMLFRASELTGSGMTAGKIDSLGFFVAANSGNVVYEDFRISIGCTTDSVLSTGSGFVSGLTQVFSPKLVGVGTGWQTHTFDIPYQWDGQSNLVVEVCFISSIVSPNQNAQTRYTATTYNSALYAFTNSTAGTCGGSSNLTASANRPNIRFRHCPSTYTYAWSNGSTTNEISGVPAGNYSVVVTNEDNCTDTLDVVISEPDPITVNFTLTNPVSCPGDCDAALSVTSTGGNGGFTYVWGDTTSTDSIRSGLCAGTYQVTATDVNGCTGTGQLTISDPPVLTATINQNTVVACAGDCNAELEVIPSGGTSPYNYLWSNGGTNSIISGLCSGGYSVTITDDNGCTTVVSDTLTEPVPWSAQITSSTDVSCPGGSDGTATAEGVYGGSTACGISTASCSGSPSVDQVGSGTSTSPLLSTPSVFGTGFLSARHQILYTASELSAAGVNPGLISEIAFDIASVWVDTLRNISVSIGCTSDTVLSTATGYITGLSSVYSSAAMGVSTGWNTITFDDNYQWDGTSSIVIDICFTNTIGFLNNQNRFTATTNNTVLFRAANSSVCATATPSGASQNRPNIRFTSCSLASTGPNNFSYTWSPAPAAGQGTSTVVGLTPGTYFVTVTDTVRNCSDTASVVITEPDTFSISETINSPVSCNGVCDGDVTINVTGGTAPYTITWPSGATGTNQNTLCGGSYTITVTDDNLCTETHDFVLDEPNPIFPNLTIDQPISCNGACDGEVSVMSTGGAGNFGYAWSNGSTDSVLTGLCSGTYSVTVTDANGCDTITSITLNDPPVLTASFNELSSISCGGTCDGELEISVSGGTTPYSYTWSNGDTTTTSDSLCSGIYTVTIIDGSNCQLIVSDTLTEPAAWNAVITSSSDVNCPNGADGEATVEAVYSSGPTCTTTTALCSSSATNSVVGTTTTQSPLLALPSIYGTGFLSARHQMIFRASELTAAGVTPGNINEISFNVTTVFVDTLRNVSISMGCTSDTVLSSATGYISGLSNVFTDAAFGLSTGWNTHTFSSPYAWDGTSNIVIDFCFNNSVGFLNNTTYYTNTSYTSVLYNGGNSNQCGASSPNTSTNRPTVRFNHCVTGAAGPNNFGYAWSPAPAAGQDSAHAVNLTAGTYTVTITDTVTGCVDTATVVINEPDTFDLTVNIDTAIQCYNGSNGVATVSATGGTPGYVFTWSDGFVGETNSGLSAGTYSITVTDTNGCVDSTSFVLSEPDSIVPNLTVLQQVSCNGACDGAAAVNPSGGNGPTYFVSWSNGVVNQDTITGLCAGQYTVTITDVLGCSRVDTLNITEPTVVSASASIVDSISCFGSCDATVAVAVAGGTPPFSFAWSTGDTTDTISGLCSGSYGVTITDGNLCSDSAVVTVVDPAAWEVNIDTLTNVSCFGDSTGSVQVSVGVSGTSPTSCGLSASACSPSGSFDLGTATTAGSPFGMPNIYASLFNSAKHQLIYRASEITGAGFPGGSIGSIGFDVAAVGGTGVFNNFTISMGCTSDTALTTTGGFVTGLSQVYFNSSDTISSGYNEYTLDQSYDWDGTSNIVVEICFTNTGTSINSTNRFTTTSYSSVLYVSGSSAQCGVTTNLNASTSRPNARFGVCVSSSGSAPDPNNLVYTWSPAPAQGQDSSFVSGLPAGTYVVTATDTTTGCFDTLEVIIAEPLPIQVTTQLDSLISCAGSCDGVASASAVGGTGSITFTWPSGTVGATDTALCAGSYIITATDSLGCEAYDTLIIGEPLPLAVSDTVYNPASCAGTCDGSAEVFVVGGTPGYSYLWSTGDTSAAVTTLCADTHTVTVTDTNGCSVIDTIIITEPLPIILTDTMLAAASCPGACDGVAAVGVSGGTPGYVITWPSGFVGDTAIGLCADTYMVTVTDTNLCTDSIAVVVTEPDTFTITITETVSIACNSVCTGELSAAVTGGNGGYSYLWSNGDTTAVADSLCTGAYTLTVTDSNGCFDTAMYIILEPSAIALTDSIVDATCGVCDGMAFISASGGSPGYSFMWSTGDTNDTVVGLCPGSYTVTVTDLVGCQDSFLIIVSNNGGADSIVFTPTTPTCFSNCDGMIVAAPNGGIPPYSYSWSTGDTTDTIAGLCTGFYSLTVTDSAGCITIDTLTLVEPSELINSIVDTNITCFNACDGSIALTTAGGTPGYSYLWSDGDTTAARTGLCAGLYVVTTTDTNGCSRVDSITLSEPAQLVPTFNQTMITCNTNCDGAIDLDVVGGTGSLSYLWNTGDTTDTISGLCAGWYTVTITDSIGCSIIDSTELINPDVIVIDSMIVSQPSCGVSDGSIEVFASGGTGTLVYVWNTTDTINPYTNLGPGSYNLEIIDSMGCSITTSVNLSNAGGPTINMDSIDVSCYNACDGEAFVNVLSGSGNYSYLWSTGDTVPALNSLCASTYYVTVTDDSSGCITVDSIVVNQPAEILISSINVTQPNCGANDGEIEVIASGGTGPLVFVWNQVDTINPYMNLGPGAYQLEVIDSTGCSVLDTVVLSSGNLTVTDSVIDASCFGTCDGSAYVMVSGAVGGIGYQWSTSPNDTLDNVSGLCAGNYTVTVTDSANACQNVHVVTVGDPGQIVLDSFIVVEPDCGFSNGSIEAFGSGGQGPLTYVWNTTDTINPLVNISSGTYNLRMIDTAGCFTDISLPVNSVGGHTLSFTTTPVDCGGNCVGTATVNVSGGSGQYSYTWNTGDTTSTVTGLCLGPIGVTVFDSATGCSVYDTVNIGQQLGLQLALTATDNTPCGTSCTGEVTVSVVGGTGTYDYQWSSAPNDTNDTVSGLCAGMYYVTVTEGGGCTTVDSIEIFDLPGLTATLDSVYTSTCETTSDGGAIISVTGGVMPYSFNWTGPNGFTANVQNLANALPGAYQVVVTDSVGCSETLNLVITSEYTIDVVANDVEVCNVSDSVWVSATVTTNGNATIQWINDIGEVFGDSTWAYVPYYGDTATYFVIANASGCVAFDTLTITGANLPDVEAGTYQEIFAGESVVLGGSPTSTTPGVTYVWTPAAEITNANASNPTATPTTTTTYEVVVTDIFGCTNSDTVTIEVAPYIKFSDGFSPNGDGVNDVWELQFLERYPDNVVEIYNRWGQLVFRSEGYTEPWDGRFEGSPLPVGSYYYIIDLGNESFVEPITGPVTIIR